MIKILVTFHYTDWLIGILILAYANPFLIGSYNPLCELNNQSFGQCSTVFAGFRGFKLMA